MPEEIDLFVDVPQEEEQQQEAEDLLGLYGKRARLVRINEAAAGAGGRGSGPPRIRLNFFPDMNPGVAARGTSKAKPVVFTAVLDEVSKHGEVPVATGRIEEDRDSWLSMVFEPEAFSLSLTGARIGLFEVVVVDAEAGLYVARQLKQSKLPRECGVSGNAAQDYPDAEEEDGEQRDSSRAATTLDLLIVYTSKVRQRLGTDAAVRARAIDAVTRGNQVLANSGLDVRLNLLQTEYLPNYREATTQRPYYTMLDQLEAGTATGLQGLHQLRATLKADLVSMLVADQSLGGLANVMGRPSTGFAPYAYSVVNYVVAASTWTLVHELGHNIGCCHETACYSGRPYGRGHSFSADGRTYKTVMVRKSQPGTRIPHFSNPQVRYRGVATGRADRDNARVIRDNAPTVARFF